MCRLSGSGGEWELWSVVSVVSCTCDRGRMLGVPSPSLSHRHTHVYVRPAGSGRWVIPVTLPSRWGR